VALSLAHHDDEQSGRAALEGQRTVSWVTANDRFSRRTAVYAVLDRNEVPAATRARPSWAGWARRMGSCSARATASESPVPRPLPTIRIP
jgi:hypothetical protein